MIYKKDNLKKIFEKKYQKKLMKKLKQKFNKLTKLIKSHIFDYNPSSPSQKLFKARCVFANKNSKFPHFQKIQLSANSKTQLQ